MGADKDADARLRELTDAASSRRSGPDLPPSETGDAPPQSPILAALLSGAAERATPADATDGDAVADEAPDRSSDDALPRVPRTETPLEQLVTGALNAAMTLLWLQTGTLLLLAATEGAPIELRFGLGFIPYVGIRSTPSQFIPVLSWAVAVSTVGTAFAVLWHRWRHGDRPEYVLGWSAGLPMGLVLIGIHAGRHVLADPVVDPRIVGQAFAVVAACALIFIAYRPTVDLREGSTPTEQFERPVKPDPERAVEPT